ncbi:MAG: hypothetical protein IPH75_15110 [bacterium]|nr:hypothetical protein [bacterium]
MISTRLYHAVDWQLIGALLFPTDKYAMAYDPDPGCYLYSQMTVDF